MRSFLAIFVFVLGFYVQAALTATSAADELSKAFVAKAQAQENELRLAGLIK